MSLKRTEQGIHLWLLPLGVIFFYLAEIFVLGFSLGTRPFESQSFDSFISYRYQFNCEAYEVCGFPIALSTNM